MVTTNTTRDWIRQGPFYIESPEIQCDGFKRSRFGEVSLLHCTFIDTSFYKVTVYNRFLAPFKFLAFGFCMDLSATRPGYKPEPATVQVRLVGK